MADDATAKVDESDTSLDVLGDDIFDPDAVIAAAAKQVAAIDAKIIDLKMKRDEINKDLKTLAGKRDSMARLSKAGERKSYPNRASRQQGTPAPSFTPPASAPAASTAKAR